MDQHFHFDQKPPQDDAWAEQVGRQGAKIFFIGLALSVAILMVAGAAWVLKAVLS
jgi:flagellar biogenesis protein FliO